MRSFILLCAALAAVSCTCSKGEKAHNFADLHARVVKHYHGEEGVQRLRRRSAAEHHQSLQEFTRNVKECDKINADESQSFSCEYNELSIESDAQKEARLGLQNMTETMEAQKMKRDVGEGIWRSRVAKRQAPASIDWIARGTQPAVKNQGGCGSCWAFGAVSALEANYYILTGEKKYFAEQEYLDCAYEGVRDGCNGGWMWTCYTYNKNNDRMAEMKDMPYNAKDNTCNTGDIPNGLTKGKVTGYAMIKGDDAKLESYAAVGVVTVAINVVSSFYGYKTGVYVCTASDCNQSINHAVTVVGYGTHSGIRFWNVRNSWGASWGDGGYIKMTRDDVAKNIINIHSYSQIPTLECRAGQTCNTPDWGEDSDDGDDGDDEGESDKGADVQCGKIVHSGGRCLSIDDSAEKYLDLSDICERTWCITDKGYLYEQATNMCANSEGEVNNAKLQLQDTCTTKWSMVANMGIQNQGDERCWHPYGGSPNPAESTGVVTYAQCPTASEADYRMMFKFDVQLCWEVESRMKLMGAIRKSTKTKNSEVAKEACMEDDRCKGLWYSHKKKKYIMRSNDTMIASNKRKDVALVKVDCQQACSEGEVRCQDGECKHHCEDEDEKEDEGDGCGAGLKRCDDGTCKHEHMC